MVHELRNTKVGCVRDKDSEHLMFLILTYKAFEMDLDCKQ